MNAELIYKNKLGYFWNDIYICNKDNNNKNREKISKFISINQFTLKILFEKGLTDQIKELFKRGREDGMY